MPIYLVLAYIVFCTVPVGMALSIIMRKRRVQKEIVALLTDMDSE